MPWPGLVVLAHHDPRGGHKGKDPGYYFEQLDYRSIYQSSINYLVGKVWNPWILPGAVAFYASDLAVARHRFVTETFSNKLWGTPLYFGAQLLLAASVATTPP